MLSSVGGLRIVLFLFSETINFNYLKHFLLSENIIDRKLVFHFNDALLHQRGHFEISAFVKIVFRVKFTLKYLLDVNLIGL